MKKNIYATIIFLILLSCKKKINNFVTISGKIENKISKEVVIIDRNTGFKKKLKVSNDGYFKDTLKTANGIFIFTDGKGSYVNLFLKNGYDLNFIIDGKKFNKFVSYSGDGLEESKLLPKLNLLITNILNDENLYDLSKSDFDNKIKNFTSEIENKISSNSLDSSFVLLEKEEIKKVKNLINGKYSRKTYIKKNLSKGKLSPKFTNYENFKGGVTSLDSFKGKFVYIDLWATWCPPCKIEIPFLKKIIKQYSGKKIQFVSISLDYKKDYEIWKKTVSDMNLKGIQLYFNGDETFPNSYKVETIPRFILIDPDGYIVDANAPSPSSPELIKLLESLDI